MKFITYFKGIFVAILIAVGGWAIFSLVRLLIERWLNSLGVTDPITQMGILVVIVLILLSIFGFGFRKAVKKLVN